MSQGSYDINFFFPKSAFAKDDTKIITVIVIIWALAVFGFQFLLKAIETPTPEPIYQTYQNVWQNVKSDSASVEEKKEIAKVYLTLLGKYISLRNNQGLKTLLTITLNDVMDEDQKEQFAAISKAAVSDKAVDVQPIADALGLAKTDILTQVIPYGLVPFDGQVADQKVLDAVPDIMDKYLIHNHSALTDFRFLGFPFHYFYTAVFLLILFCCLCLYYCHTIDKIMKKHGMEQDE